MSDALHQNLDCQVINNIAISWMVLIFISSFLATMIPYIFKLNNTNFTSFINCIGAGALLGTCFFHLFPEIIELYLMNRETEMSNW